MIQLQVLNKIIKDGDASILLLNNIDESFFSDYVEEFRYVRNHLDTYGKVPDQVTFLAHFPSFDIIEVNESSRYLVEELYKDKSKLFLAHTFNSVRNLLNDGKVDEAMAVYMSSMDKAVKAKHLDSVSIIEDTSRYDAYLDRCNNFSKYYIKTGFKELDEVIGGWDKEEELATIVARPGIGKSWVLLKTAVAALEQGLRVGIYSGEMSERKVGYRFDTLVSNLSNYGITKGNADLQNEYKRYIDSLKDKYEGDLRVLTPAMIDGPAGVTALRAFIEKEQLDILCIDQHSLLEDDRHARNPVDKASNISRDLKNLQVLKHIPIIAVSQQNRDSTDTGVDVSHVAQSDRIGQDSTIVIFLEQKDDVLTLSLIKSRDSEAGKKLKYAVNLNKGVFDYIPTENDALNGSASQTLKEEYESDVF